MAGEELETNSNVEQQTFDLCIEEGSEGLISG